MLLLLDYLIGKAVALVMQTLTFIHGKPRFYLKKGSFMKAQRDIASFVLRFTQELWQDPQGEPRVEWRGHIRHVQDGDEFRFTELTDVMNFIQQSLLKLTMDRVPKEDKMYQDKALRESFKLWEKFATSYTEVMTEAFQQTVKQSETFQKQVAEAVEQAIKPWWLMGFPNHVTEPKPEKSANIEQEQLLETIVALQAQIATLTNKVSKLEEALTTLAQSEHTQG